MAALGTNPRGQTGIQENYKAVREAQDSFKLQDQGIYDMGRGIVQKP
jgi:hypothetical protein